MPGLFDWVDPTREYINGRIQKTNALADFIGDLALDKNKARQNVIAALIKSPKFQVPDDGGLDEAMAFWNPGGLLGTMAKNSIPKLAKSAAAAQFETGAPASAVGFHGSPSPEVQFDPSRPAFLTSHPDVANTYTSERGMWRRMPSDGATVYPARVEFQNPLVVDALGKRYDNVPAPWVNWEPKVFGNLPKKALSVSDLADIAKMQGHDGLIVKNVIDAANVDDKLKSTVYAALSPDSIESFFSAVKKPK